MGKRLRKRDLLDEIRQERAALDALLHDLSPRQMTQSGATLAGWSVKDILGHVVGWQELNLGWHAAECRGETPAVPAPGLTWGDVRQLNDRIYRKHHRRSLKSVLEDYELFHEKMLALIEGLSDRDLVTMSRFQWTGPTWTLSDYIRANTASHYRWACKHIRKWNRRRASDSPAQ